MDAVEPTMTGMRVGASDFKDKSGRPIKSGS